MEQCKEIKTICAKCRLEISWKEVEAGVGKNNYCKKCYPAIKKTRLDRMRTDGVDRFVKYCEQIKHKQEEISQLKSTKEKYIQSLREESKSIIRDEIKRFPFIKRLKLLFNPFQIEGF